MFSSPASEEQSLQLVGPTTRSYQARHAQFLEWRQSRIGCTPSPRAGEPSPRVNLLGEMILLKLQGGNEPACYSIDELPREELIRTMVCVTLPLLPIRLYEDHNNIPKRIGA